MMIFHSYVRLSEGIPKELRPPAGALGYSDGVLIILQMEGTAVSLTEDSILGTNSQQHCCWVLNIFPMKTNPHLIYVGMLARSPRKVLDFPLPRLMTNVYLYV